MSQSLRKFSRGPKRLGDRRKFSSSRQHAKYAKKDCFVFHFSWRPLRLCARYSDLVGLCRVGIIVMDSRVRSQQTLSQHTDKDFPFRGARIRFIAATNGGRQAKNVRRQVALLKTKDRWILILYPAHKMPNPSNQSLVRLRKTSIQPR